MLGKVMRLVKEKQKLSSFRRLWRSKNAHNATYAENIFDADKVSVGKRTYGPLRITNYGSNNCRIQIGAYCSIAGNVKFLSGGEHDWRLVSTYPFKNNILEEKRDTGNKGDIIIGDDVWLGEDVLILSGVHIGQGAVVAAGSVVAKDIPPYAIVGGTPARVIKYRCGEQRIKELLCLDYTKLTDEMIKQHEKELYEDINAADLRWFPRKALAK